MEARPAQISSGDPQRPVILTGIPPLHHRVPPFPHPLYPAAPRFPAHSNRPPRGGRNARTETEPTENPPLTPAAPRRPRLPGNPAPFLPQADPGPSIPPHQTPPLPPTLTLPTPTEPQPPLPFFLLRPFFLRGAPPSLRFPRHELTRPGMDSPEPRHLGMTRITPRRAHRETRPSGPEEPAETRPAATGPTRAPPTASADRRDARLHGLSGELGGTTADPPQRHLRQKPAPDRDRPHSARARPTHGAKVSAEQGKVEPTLGVRDPAFRRGGHGERAWTCGAAPPADV